MVCVLASFDNLLGAIKAIVSVAVEFSVLGEIYDQVPALATGRDDILSADDHDQVIVIPPVDDKFPALRRGRDIDDVAPGLEADIASARMGAFILRGHHEPVGFLGEGDAVDVLEADLVVGDDSVLDDNRPINQRR